MSEIDEKYQEFIDRVHMAEEWQYLAVKAGKIARKSDMDDWLMERYGIDAYDARRISNQVTEGLPGERRPFVIGDGGARWLAERAEPTVVCPCCYGEGSQDHQSLAPDICPLCNGDGQIVFDVFKKWRDALTALREATYGTSY